jgi:hypothetical protein
MGQAPTLALAGTVASAGAHSVRNQSIAFENILGM